MQKLNGHDIKLIIDALHRDAQRCDDVVENHLIDNNMKNIAFYLDKAAKLRDIAHAINENASNFMQKNKHSKHLKTLNVVEIPKFSPHVVRVFSPVKG